MGWRDYSAAPGPGTPVCAADQVGTVLAVDVAGPRGSFPILVVRRGGGFRGYVNACPHQYLPLNHRGDQLLSADGTMLLCTAHGARFDIDTGAAIGGADCGLDPVPLAVAGEMLVIADEG